QKLPSRLSSAAGTLKSVTVGVFAAATQLITVLTIAFLLLLDGQRLLEAAFRLMRSDREARYRKVAGDVYRAISGYVAGNLLISVIAGTVTYITLKILGVPFAAPLSVLMAFLDLIPIVGATIGGLAIGIVTAFHDFPTSTIIWVIVFIVYQQVENNLLQPIIYRRTVNVPPLAVIVAVLIGGSLLGVLGALVAIPIAAMVQILGRDWWDFRQQREPAEGGDPAMVPP
ncbi:MAG: AI-2E family transporter, partial [Actinomycetota bacterium]|nr:AI-2E family transporter [Actinomycetota bacterium]